MKSVKDKLDLLSHREKLLTLATAILPPPVKLDNLIGIGSLSPVQVLQSMEKLVNNNLLKIAPEGTGHYQLKAPCEADVIINSYDRSRVHEVAETLLRSIKGSDIPSDKKSLVTANIIIAANLTTHLEDVEKLLKAAEYCLGIGALEAASIYFKHVLETSRDIPESYEHTYFIDAALGLISAHGHLMPLHRQRELLQEASRRAGLINNQEKLCLLNLRLAQIIKTEGDYPTASALSERAWDIAKNLNRDDLLRQAALFTSDFLFWQGLIADAVSRYEEVIGDAENFPADQATLRATATLGWCYGICGRTARGIGLIEAVRNRAESLKLVQVKAYADIMAVLTLLDVRRISEAEGYLDNVFQYPEETLGNYILWAGYASRAFILCEKGDLRGCFHFQSKAFEKSKEIEWPHHRGPWNFEYMDVLEDAGMIHPEMNYDSEINRLSQWPDVYMQGVGMRYRAKRNLKRNGPGAETLSDLDKSIELLTKAGAWLELARTQLLLARLKLQDEPDSTSARSLLKSAWEVLSSVNPDLFPDELRPYLEYESKEDAAFATLLEVGRAIGTVRDRDHLLTRIISLLLRLTGAGRGGVFLLNSRNWPELVASRNLDQTILESRQFEKSRDLISHVIETGKETIRSEDTESGWRLCYPVTLGDHFFGVIYLDNTLAGLSPPRNIVSLLKLVISQMAVAIDNAKAYEEIEKLKDRLEDETMFYRRELEHHPQTRQIVGESKSIRSVLAQIEKVAETDSNVLITGETGVGKELVAHAIHRQSACKEGPFIPVNTASLSTGVVASELFGHEKGAFTGASNQRRGRFELADGGTLFLDDIDALSMEVQAKILRAIQEKEFERVGGTRTVKSNFRLIAATNADLEEMIRQNKFRIDLYYRLNVFPVHIPPLRERKEDITILATHFLDLFNYKMGKNIKGFTKENIKTLSSYSWPGNIRELKHIIERAVILSDGDHIVLPELVDSQGTGRSAEEFLTYREMEKTHILNALTKCEGKVSGRGGAAELLDLKPTTLYARIRKFGIKKKFDPAS